MEHVTVLKQEAIDKLNIKEDGIYVDCTLGGGGHSEAILKRLTTGHLYMFDQDTFAINKAKERLAPFEDKFTIIKDNFVNIRAALNAHNVTQVDGILYDLGVSSFHFDDPSRGFSYNHDAFLDMRMDQAQEKTAYTIVNHEDERTIKTMLYRYADETQAPRIAKAIIRHREDTPIETTFDLVNVIKDALPEKILRKKGHPAKKTFQALRIAVNDELQVFETSLQDALTLLKKDGRIVVISFHSLEDRIAKHVFKDATTIDHPKGLVTMPKETPDFELINRKIITPSDEEIAQNNRAHSAKLRAIKKL
jgi:16S rRNA (cytosine1402-N4)-methyltransferase